MFHKTLESFFNHFNLIMFEVRIEFTSPFKYIKKMKLPLPTIFCRLCSRASFEDPSYNRSRYVNKNFSHFVLYMVSIYTEVHLKYELRPTVCILTGTVTVMYIDLQYMHNPYCELRVCEYKIPVARPLGE